MTDLMTSPPGLRPDGTTAGTVPRTRRYRPGAAATTAMLAPGTVVLLLFAAAPMVALLVTGFSHDSAFTFANFSKVLHTAVYMRLLVRTLVVALIVTVVSLAVAWPAAWALARYVGPRPRQLILVLVIVPYVTSQLLLIYGFITLIQSDGPLMKVLSLVGLDAHSSIMYTPAAAVLMMIYESIPTGILVMYSAATQVDDSVLEAARALGAGRAFVLTRVVWPLSVNMLVIGFALTYVQTVGAFAEPGILGGPSGQLLGNAIEAQLHSGTDRPFAIAMALVLLLCSLVVVGLVSLVLRRTQGDGRSRR